MIGYEWGIICMVLYIKVIWGILNYVGVFCGVFCFGIHTRLDMFEYVGYPLVCLSVFACKWVFYRKFFNVLVCFCMLCSLLNLLTQYLWVHFLKSTKNYFWNKNHISLIKIVLLSNFQTNTWNI